MLSLLDFFLGEQPHSLQLLQLRDSVLDSLLYDLCHVDAAAVKGSGWTVPGTTVIISI